jgi:hypothetical protein
LILSTGADEWRMKYSFNVQFSWWFFFNVQYSR